MAEVGILDPSGYESFPLIDPSDPVFFDPTLLPEDLTIPADFSSDLDFDDIDVDLDLDFSMDEFLQIPSEGNGDHLPPFSDASPEIASSGEISGEFPSPPVSGIPNSDSNIDQPSPESGNSTSSCVEEKPGMKRKKADGISNSNPREEANSPSSCVVNAGSDEEDKKKARLMRNRESAQLSRQRKKHYVDELEDKVKAMHSTIAELNSKISFVMAENASLRQQLGGAHPPPPAAFLPSPPIHFPWMPGYLYHRPQGSQVPLVPIPRMKLQKPEPAPKAKKPGGRTKKLASMSLLGFLFVALMFGACFRYGGSEGVSKVRILRESKDGVVTIDGDGNGLNGTDRVKAPDFAQNSSESLPALLYVPRNGRHVKIDGNLIIHSVLAGEKAMAEKTSRDEAKRSSAKGTGLAIAGNVASALAVPRSGLEVERHSKSYKGSDRDAGKSTPADGPLQQWFRQELAGPILSSGMCTEVFQFEVSRPQTDPSGVIVPAASITVNTTKSGRHAGKAARNRRILYPDPIPLPGPTLNDTQHIRDGSSSSGGGKNASVSSMVVSVLVDPQEADGDDGMMSQKSLSRIFVVVLLDSVKYVTYSCVLPFKTSSPHLVN